MHKPSTLIALADTHCGSPVGLCHGDGVDLDDGGHYSPSAGQQWLYLNLQDFVAKAKRAARRRAVFVVFAGDLVHGKPKATAQVITDDMATQREIARVVLQPLVEMADYLFVFRGSEAHVGGCGESEETLATYWASAGGPAQRSRAGTWSWYEDDIEVGGVVFNCAHSCSAGRNVGNAATEIARAVKAEYDDRHRRPPDIVLRAHVHRTGDSGHNIERTRCIILPAWTERDNYARKLNARRASVGGLLMQCDAGVIEWESLETYAPVLPLPWKAKA